MILSDFLIAYTNYVNKSKEFVNEAMVDMIRINRYESYFIIMKNDNRYSFICIYIYFNKRLNTAQYTQLSL